MDAESWVREILDFCKKNFLESHFNSDFNAKEIELISEKRLRIS
jgi:hypothetical protein